MKSTCVGSGMGCAEDEVAVLDPSHLPRVPTYSCYVWAGNRDVANCVHGDHGSRVELGREG